MGFLKNKVEIKNGTKVTLSEMNLKKLEKTYETDLFDRKDKRIFTTFRKESHKCFQTQVRDFAFERILDHHLYTFKHILVIPDPYGMAPQTALILFNSSAPAKVRYLVHGESGMDDFSGESILTKRHRVPVFGLYQGKNNNIDLWLLDEHDNIIKHREIKIFVPNVTLSFEEKVNADNTEAEYFPLLLLNGANHRPVVIDGKGRLRYWLRLDDTNIGIKPLSSGRFLVVDSMANRVDETGSIIPGRYHEMDYMGRVYRSFLVEYNIGDAIASFGDSLFFVLDSDENHANDRIAELDMNSGDIVSECDLHDLFGDRHYSDGNWTGVCYMEYSDGMLLVSAKILHTVFLLNWETKQIEWLISPDAVWEGTEVSKYRLKVLNYKDCICSRPGNIVTVSGNLSGKAEIILFDMGFKGKVDTGRKTPNKSLIKRMLVDSDEMSLTVLSTAGVDKCTVFGEVLLTDNDKYVVAAEGQLYKRVASRKSHIDLIDMENNNACFGINLAKIFTKAWLFKPSIEDCCKHVPFNQDVLFGGLHSPQVFDGKFPKVSDKSVEKKYFSRVTVCDDLFLFSMVPGSVKYLYFKGENCTYVQDYTGINKSKKKMRFVVTMKDFVQGEYDIYVETKSGIYKLKSEVRVYNDEL